MPENKAFSVEEDQLIRHLYQEMRIKKWGMIAKTLTEDYNFPRNAKQCRDRYRQFLDPQMQAEWTKEEQGYLYRLHNQIGNKWALIATYFPGRTDNCVKNHFYSKLRKSLRHLNKIIKKHFKKEFWELKIGALYKIIEGFEEQFKEKPIVPQEVSNYCAGLKDALLLYANEKEEEPNMSLTGNWIYERQRMLLTSIVQFSRNYKKKTKKEKKESMQGLDLFKSVKKLEEIANDEESEYEEINDDASSASDEQEREREDLELRKSPKVYIIVEDQSIRESNRSINSKVQINLDAMDESEGKMDEEIEIRDKFPGALRGSAGSGSADLQKYPFGFMRGLSSSFKSYNSQTLASSGSKPDVGERNAENIRNSESTKIIVQSEMVQERQECLSRSQRAPNGYGRHFY